MKNLDKRPAHAEDLMEGQVSNHRKRMPLERNGLNHKVEITDETTGLVQEGYIIANWHEGQISEIFLQGFGKEGSTLEGWVQLAAILFSTLLQYGGELPMLARKLAHMKFPPYGPTANPEIPYCRSVPDYILRWLALKHGDQKLLDDLEAIGNRLEAQGL